MSAYRLPRPPRVRIPTLAAILTLVAVVLTAGAPEPIALVSGVAGTGTAILRRASGGTETLAAGVRLMPGDFLEARDGPVTVTLFDLGNDGLVTVPMVADSPIEATKALAAEQPTILGGFWSGLKSLVAGDATSAQRFGGAMAGQTSEPAPAKELARQPEETSFDSSGLKKASLRRLSSMPSSAAGPGRPGAKADDTSGGAGGNRGITDNESFEFDRNTVSLGEVLETGGGGPPSPSSAFTPQTIAESEPADDQPGDDEFGGDEDLAAAVPREDRDEGPSLASAPAVSGEDKKKARLALPPPPSGGPFELPERSGHLIPLGNVRLVLQLNPAVQTLTLQINRELPTRKDLVKEVLPIGRGADGRTQAVATLDLVRLGLQAGDVISLQARDGRGRFRLKRWYAVGTPEDVLHLRALIARARDQKAPPARQALLLLAAEAAVALNAPTTARELYDDLMNAPGLSEQDKEAFGSASAFLRRAAGSSRR